MWLTHEKQTKSIIKYENFNSCGLMSWTIQAQGPLARVVRLPPLVFWWSVVTVPSPNGVAASSTLLCGVCPSRPLLTVFWLVPIGRACWITSLGSWYIPMLYHSVKNGWKWIWGLCTQQFVLQVSQKCPWMVPVWFPWGNWLVAFSQWSSEYSYAILTNFHHRVSTWQLQPCSSQVFMSELVGYWEVLGLKDTQYVTK